jgi:hypothetical protein
MRGFLVGSLVLVVVYVAVQPNAASALSAGSTWWVSGLRRALSPGVAGVPQLGKQTPPTTGASGGGSVVRPR